MPDARHQKLAQVLVHYSLALKPGDKLIIRSDENAAPLIREVLREATRAGAHVHTDIGLSGTQEIALAEGNDEQLSYIWEADKAEMNECTALLGIFSTQNTKALSGIDPARIALANKARAPLNQRLNERTAAGEMRWCATLYPTAAFAQEAGMSLSDYEDFVFRAGMLDQAEPVVGWQAVEREQQHIIDYLSKHDAIHIVANGTDITYHVGGRTWMNASGRTNFPDGEVFTGPIEDSVNGIVSFSYPAIFGGNEVENVQLTFENGKVVDSKASRGLDFLNAMLDMDEGSRYLGEVAFGLNYNIPRFSKHMLFDEKLGGTMHMALGAAYPETGGTNKSGLHWDMLCDLRDGKVYADGELCYEAGKFTI